MIKIEESNSYNHLFVHFTLSLSLGGHLKKYLQTKLAVGRRNITLFAVDEVPRSAEKTMQKKEIADMDSVAGMLHFQYLIS